MKRRSPNRLPDALVAAMYADYRRLGSMDRAAALHGRCAGTLLGIFRSRGLPSLGDRGARVARTRKARLDGRVAEMHALYLKGSTFAEVERTFGVTGARDLFRKRGLFIRPPRENRWREHRSDGTFARRTPLTAAQIDDLIAGATTMKLPEILRTEWRSWPMRRRAEFIARMRARLQPANTRPETPFSRNVTPFDYASPEARAIADAMNAGRTSRNKAVQIRFGSQGVIYQGRLWFCSSKVGYVSGPWTPENGRPELHRAIWEETHGRPVPAAHVVRFADGNPNNFTPKNLVLASRNDVVRENQAGALFRKSRAQIGALLTRGERRKTTTTKHANTDTLTQLSRGHALRSR